MLKCLTARLSRCVTSLLVIVVSASVLAQAASLPKEMKGRWTFMGKRTNSDVMSVLIDGDGAPGKVTGHLSLRGSNCGALDEPFQGTWDGAELRFDAVLRANVNTRLSGQQCAADATKFVLTRKQGQTSFEGEGTASTGNFQVTLAP